MLCVASPETIFAVIDCFNAFVAKKMPSLKYNFSVRTTRMFLNNMVYSTPMTVMEWESNMKIIATYNYKTHRWSNDVPSVASKMYEQDCCCCHTHRNRNEQILIQIDDEYMMIGADCLDMIRPSEFFKDYEYKDIDTDSALLDDEISSGTSTTKLYSLERFVDVFTFIRNYKKVYATNSTIYHAYNEYAEITAEPVNDNLKKWMCSNAMSSDNLVNLPDAIAFLEQYANSEYNEDGNEYNYSLMMIARDILNNEENLIHRNAIPLMVNAIYSYFENKLYESASTKEMDKVDTTVRMVGAKIQNSRYGSKYKYCFMDDRNNLFVYYTTKYIPEGVGNTYHLRCKSVECVMERGTKVIRLKRASLKEI